MRKLLCKDPLKRLENAALIMEDPWFKADPSINWDDLSKRRVPSPMGSLPETDPKAVDDLPSRGIVEGFISQVI